MPLSSIVFHSCLDVPGWPGPIIALHCRHFLLHHTTYTGSSMMVSVTLNCELCMHMALTLPQLLCSISKEVHRKYIFRSTTTQRKQKRLIRCNATALANVPHSGTSIQRNWITISWRKFQVSDIEDGCRDGLPAIRSYFMSAGDTLTDHYQSHCPTLFRVIFFLASIKFVFCMEHPLRQQSRVNADAVGEPRTRKGTED